jgi:hypothetical protein
MRVNAFGIILEVIKENGQWVIYILGEGKKRRSYDFVIPSEFDEDGALLFLNDLLHERATPDNPEIKKID